MPLFFLQANSQPTTIDGAFVVILLAVAALINPLFDKVIIPIVKAFITRINIGSDQKVQELEAFKALRSEVDRLQSERQGDKETINKMQKEIFDLQKQLFLITQTANEKDAEINKLRRELAECIESKTLVVAKA